MIEEISLNKGDGGFFHPCFLGLGQFLHRRSEVVLFAKLLGPGEESNTTAQQVLFGVLVPADGWFFQEMPSLFQPSFFQGGTDVPERKPGLQHGLWRLHGINALATVYSSGVADQFERGRASVEFVLMTRQYLRLAHLVGVA